MAISRKTPISLSGIGAFFISFEPYVFPLRGFVRVSKAKGDSGMIDETRQLQSQEERLLAGLERGIAYKNIQFILAHQNDTREQLTAYLKACMEDLGHAPAKVEVIGGDLIEYRFGSWKKAIGKIYNGKMDTVKNPPAFKDRKIVQELHAALSTRGGKEPLAREVAE